MAHSMASREVDDCDLTNQEDFSASIRGSNLRRVPDCIPWVVLLVLIVELGE